MKDLNKIEEEEAAVDQNDSEKGTTKSTTAKQSKTLTGNIVDTKETRPASKRETKAATKTVVVKSPKKQKAEIEPMVQNVVAIDLKEEKEKPESDKKQKIKVAKKTTKQSEEKVDKLKQKVKKAKKKEVKKSKLKDLKDKLEKAIKKMKASIKKLKKAKK